MLCKILFIEDIIDSPGIMISWDSFGFIASGMFGPNNIMGIKQGQ
jgi:hypothetical protein